MGNSQQNEQKLDSNFQMHKYLNQGLNQKQVLLVREAFLSYLPTNGSISVEKYKACLQQSQLKDKVMNKLGNRQELDFDEFFNIQKQLLLSHLKENPSTEFDSTQIEPPSNFLCPYATEVVRR